MMAGERIGQTIGKWHIDALAGSGGMGAVYRASRIDGEVRTTVAIKFLYGSSDAARSVEAAAMRAVESPHVVRLIEQGVAPDGQEYLVMEYVEGKPITMYADQMGLTIEERLRLFTEVCQAVAAIHEKEYLHLDLKPGNILVNGAGSVKVIDFGIARRAGFVPAIDRAEPFTGPWAAPEQVRGEAPTRAADVYSLGAVLYELLSGHPPFDPALSGAELQKRVLDVDPKPPSLAAGRAKLVRQPSGKYGELPPQGIASMRGCRNPAELRRKLERRLDAVCLFAMRKDASRRYHYTLDMAQDLNRISQGLKPRLARTGDPVALGLQTARRKPLVVTGVMIAVSAAFGAWAFPDMLGGARTSANDIQAQADRTADSVTDELRTKLQPALAQRLDAKDAAILLESVLKAAKPVPRTKSQLDELRDSFHRVMQPAQEVR